ncbi:MAG: PP0621 family protein [Gammaproteobacteria bacterium]|jgi:hypothetical protein|nr:PP0621 family protein [Gammaproteobacteria bacterium]
MGLFRLLTFILVAFIAWRMIKNYQTKVSTRENESEKVKIPVREKMVKCEICDIHLPKEEAISFKDADAEYWFCTPEHKETFNQQGS